MNAARTGRLDLNKNTATHARLLCPFFEGERTCHNFSNRGSTVAIALPTPPLRCPGLPLEALDPHTAVLTFLPGEVYHHWQDQGIIWSSESKDIKLGDHSGGKKKKKS